ncbi:hypothetical protein J5226_08285 [Lysobacter sp. K5869]|uniref:hypothetical protein n=1 Tax=Lysobacter sp. K5869 TaxID=2820808 RepID=UPI001C061CC3|nr:hypothetical protein [Lysobacter sp. K5869]QWP78374.1 hypothetical protein J5226_08285 [Lysobacter sp. K5869]
MNRRKSGRAAMAAKMAAVVAGFAGAALPAAAGEWTPSGRYQYFSETALGGGQGANACQNNAAPLASGDCRADPATGWAANFTASMAAADADEAAATCAPGYPSACRYAGYAIDGRGVAAGETFDPARDLPRPCVAGTYAVSYLIVRRPAEHAHGAAGEGAIDSDYAADEFKCR